ncbi:MAG: hypothetical protein E2O57_04840 [Gammaproteobacteria bacterium]|nr:MAG: hypothetical protein E2O57_04840 [Gammaproteobacteria bacterium]
MLKFHLESWAAIAPGLESKNEWGEWLQHPCAIHQSPGDISLDSIPAILRRRFNTLGRYATAAALPLVKEIDAIPSIFASRHGDTELSFSLLESIGRNQPMSPAGFSFAVHNAVGGLFSISRKDTSEVTAIAAMEGLVLQTFIEAIGQLQNNNRVLCVIYDIPLPGFYHDYCGDDIDPFPYAIAMVLNNRDGISYHLEPTGNVARNDVLPASQFDIEPLKLIRFLSDLSNELELVQNGSIWRIEKVGT